jgi:hypothetical protein
MIIDNESEPGAWKREMEKAPWAYGQKREPDVLEILTRMRAHGLDVEADIIARELALSFQGKTAIGNE